MAHSDAILQAVQRIHEAPLACDGWVPALAAIAGAVGGDRAFLFTQNLSTGRVESAAGFDMSSQHLEALSLAANTGALPRWAPTMLPGTVTPSSAMASDRDFAKSVFYNEVIRPIGDFYGLASSPIRDRERNVYLAVGRRLGREDYEEGDTTTLQILLPHIARAIQVGWRITAAERRANSLGAALEKLETGVIVADAAASILFTNSTADRLLSGARGLSTDKDGLCASDPAETRELRRLVRQCASMSLEAGENPGSITLGRRTSPTPLRVLVSSFRPAPCAMEALFARPAAIVLVSDPERSLDERKERLRQRFGLTPMEALVALEVVNGQGRAAAARHLDIAVATIKTHLMHIFEKTGVSRQAELVRLILDEAN